ncbi:MAG: undecaprenyl-diphosphate phosphatase [Parcubacteria group bacterium]
MLESIITGAIQGIFEWLPVSSGGIIVLTKVYIFGNSESAVDLIRFALFLHIGTVAAAIVYFRRDVIHLIKSLFSFSESKERTKRLIAFLIVSSVVTGILGIVLLDMIGSAESEIMTSSRIFTIFVGILLVITAVLQFKKGSGGLKNESNLTTGDGIFMGIMQGIAALPGLSRSGLTVASLMLRKFNDTTALKVSFLMSIPVVIGGNILVNFDKFQTFSMESFISLVTAFVMGLITIHLLLVVARKVQFGYFVLGFAILTFLAATL